MALTVKVQLGIVGSSVTRVKLQSCNSACATCTDLAGYTDVPVSSFQPLGLIITNVPDGTVSIKAIALDAACPNTSQCMVLSTGLFNDFTSDPEATPLEACYSILFNPDPTVGNASSFCASTTLTNEAFRQPPAGTFYIAYKGAYLQVTLVEGNSTATVVGTCLSCPTTTTTTSTTTTTTTAAPSNFSYGIILCEGGTSTVISQGDALNRFAYYYHPNIGCFQVASAGTPTASPGLSFKSIVDCADPTC
jgi:hypothetical protein